MSKKKDKRERKMTPEQLQVLLHMRTRGYVQKNGKAYKRKAKHKEKDNDWNVLLKTFDCGRRFLV